MIHAYDKNYLEKAKTTMAHMLDYVVYDLQYDMGDFFQLFIESGMARRFEREIPVLLRGIQGWNLPERYWRKVDGFLRQKNLGMWRIVAESTGRAMCWHITSGIVAKVLRKSQHRFL